MDTSMPKKGSFRKQLKKKVEQLTSSQINNLIGVALGENAPSLFLLSKGLSYRHLQVRGFTIPNLIRRGFTSTDLFQLGAPSRELEGITGIESTRFDPFLQYHDLTDANGRPKDKEVTNAVRRGVSPTILIAAHIKPYALWRAGLSIRTLIREGCSIFDLHKNHIPVEAFLQARIPIEKLLADGVSQQEINQAFARLKSKNRRKQKNGKH